MPISYFKAQTLRDLRIAIRSGGGWFHTVFFFAVFAGLSAFAIGPVPNDLASAAPALLWLGAALAVQFSAMDLFHDDLEDGSLQALAAEQSSLVSYIAAKLLVMLITAGLPILLITPLFYIVFAVSPEKVLVLTAITMTGMPILILANFVAAALLAGMRSGGLLGAGLAAPLIISPLIFGIGATERLLEGSGLISPEYLMLGALTLIYLVVLPPFAIVALRLGFE